ncbi:MAG: TIGR01906 family membrane protein [Dorea sp.]|nr:TIGR01906 family membrane protein [Dorea sp.]
MKKTIYKISATIVMLLLIFSWLLTSFQLAIYGDPDYRFYRNEYEKYNVMEDLDMDIEGVMEVTDYMMDYLIGREEVLSIVTNVDGKNQDFFNDRDRSHMEDVRNMFLGGLKLRNVLTVFSILVILILLLLGFRNFHSFYNCYIVAFGLFVLSCLVLGIWAARDFNGFFTQFHHIFFEGDTWLFDWNTDYMIRMLVEDFFADFVARIGSFFVGGLFASFLIMFGGNRILSGRKKKA